MKAVIDNFRAIAFALKHCGPLPPVVQVELAELADEVRDHVCAIRRAAFHHDDALRVAAHVEDDHEDLEP